MSLKEVASKIGRLFKTSKPSGRSLQLRLDAAKLYTLLQSFQHLHQLPSLQTPEPCDDEDDIACDLGIESLPPVTHQAAVIKYHLITSTRRILRATLGSMTSRSPDQHLRTALPFTPVIASSTIKSAGRGLFVNGVADPGTIVALYPGISYLPSQFRTVTLTNSTHAREAGSSDENAEDLSDYAIARYDGVVIDGAVEVEIELDESVQKMNKLNLGETPDLHHPFANGHLVNHPPPGTQANVLQFMLDIDVLWLGFPLANLMPVQSSDIHIGHLDQYVNMATRQRVRDVQHFLSSARSNRVLRTVALVALRSLRDEEIFMDYRFNPSIEPPGWYTSCGDGSDASRRWDSRSVFG